MNEEEKKIQEATEKGTDLPEFREDIKAYALLFKGLAEEDETMPAFSASFAEKVADRIEERALVKITYKEYALKVAAVFLFIIASAIAVAAAGAAPAVLESLSSAKWYILITALLLLVIDFADKKLVKKVI